MLLSKKDISLRDKFHYQTLVGKMPFICGFLNMQGRIIMTTPAVKRIMGYDLAEIVGRSIKRFIHPDDYIAFSTEIKNVLQTKKQSATLEYRARYANGDYRWQQINWELIRNEKKELEVFFYAVDINDRKLNEISLRHVFDTLPDGISMYEHGLIRYSNRALAELFGIDTIDQMIDKNILSFVAKKDKQMVNDYAKRRAAGDETVPVDYEAYFQKVNGEEFLGQIKVRKINLGYKESWVLVIRDITKQRRQEEENRLESLGAIAGGIAHDFNNILTGIMGYSQLIDLDQRDAADYIKKIQEQIMRAAYIANQLMTFSKGGLPVKENCSFKDLLKNYYEFLKVGLNINVEFDIAQDLWLLSVDIKQIVNVLENLFKNAKDAMPHGGSVWVKANNQELAADNEFALAPGKYVRIMIKDNGPGIPENILKRIFQPWNSSKEEGKGTGLGLYSVYGIIKKHDGKIDVRSSPNEGTEFTIYLPVGSQNSIVSFQKYNERERFVGHGERVLVLEDEESITQLLKRNFEFFKLNGVFTKNGQEVALLYAQALGTPQAFSMVILDLTIPGGIGGKETIALLREIDPEVNAVVTTGYSEDSILSNYRKYGFNDYLPKPYLVEDLNDLLLRRLGGK